MFDGLTSEGWLWNIAEKSWKINRRDRMSLFVHEMAISLDSLLKKERGIKAVVFLTSLCY